MKKKRGLNFLLIIISMVLIILINGFIKIDNPKNGLTTISGKIINLGSNNEYEISSNSLTLVIKNLTFTPLSNRSIRANIDVNGSCYFENVSIGTKTTNVTFLWYNNSGTTLVKQTNFTLVSNGTSLSEYFNQTNYTKGDTIVLSAYAWNDTDNSTIINISSFINRTENNFVCNDNESCGFQNITEALYEMNNTINNTGSSIIILQNNSIQTININSLYNITVSKFGAVINITADNVTLDCNYNIIQGNYSGDGISLYGFNNITIKNCKIKMYNRGVYILTSFNLNFTNNIIWNNTGIGGRFIWVNNSFFINNTINDTRGENAVGGWATQFQDCNNNTISYNNVFGNSEHGIYTNSFSSNNIITYNNVSFNDDSAFVIGGINNLIAHNFLENNKEGSIYCMYDSTNRNNDTYNKVINNTIIGEMDGPGPASPEGHGMVLWGYNYEVWNNTIINNTRYGIYFLGGNDSIIIGNLFINQTNNSYGAIYFNGSENTQNVIIKNNILINNTFGVFLNNSLYTNWSIINNSINYGLIGLYIKNMNNSDIINNTFNETGNLTNYQINFPLEIYNSSNLNITGNYFYNLNQTIKAINIDPISYNLTFWYNSFYGDNINGTIENTTGCYNDIGNFYRNQTGNLLKGECGVVNLTNLLGGNNYTTQTSLALLWQNQSSYNSTIWYSLFYSINDGLTWTFIKRMIDDNYTLNLNSLIQAQNIILKIYASDEYMNTTGDVSDPFTIDTLGPSISLIPSSDTTIKQNENLPIECLASNTNINLSSMEVTLDGTTICSSTGTLLSLSCSYDYSTIELGNKNLMCQATDIIGQTNTQSITITVSGDSSSSEGGTEGSSVEPPEEEIIPIPTGEIVSEIEEENIISIISDESLIGTLKVGLKDVGYFKKIPEISLSFNKKENILDTPLLKFFPWKLLILILMIITYTSIVYYSKKNRK